jgi:DNA-directed RNA polymerase subunit F
MEIINIEQRAVTLSEVKETLESLKKEKKELNFRAERVYEYAGEFNTLKKKQADELFEKIKALNVPRLQDRHIIKIIDVMPESVEAIKATLNGENITLKNDDVMKIVEAIK